MAFEPVSRFETMLKEPREQGFVFGDQGGGHAQFVVAIGRVRRASVPRTLALPLQWTRVRSPSSERAMLPSPEITGNSVDEDCDGKDSKDGKDLVVLGNPLTPRYAQL